MQVEDKALTVACGNLLQRGSGSLGVAVRRLTVGHVDQGRRIRMRVFSAPFGQHLSSFRQCFAHRRATQAARLEPDRELQRAADHAALDLTVVLLNSARVLSVNWAWLEDGLRKIDAKP